ncbi:ADP-ribosylglycohydrolase family protein [Propionibacteriaceae bacterium Y2011]
MKLTAAQTDRAIGTLVGAAAGDALGAGYEFGSAVIDGRPAMIGGGLGGFAPGEWTDDTAQTYAIAEVAATGADLRDEAALDAIAGRFADWYASRPPDVGILTRQVLGAAGRQPSAADVRDVARRVHESSGRSGGNGTLMRTAAVALAHLGDPVAIVEAATAVAALTHHDPVGGEASALWCLAISHTVIEGELPGMAALVEHLPASRREFWMSAVEKAESAEPATFSSNGYVVGAFQAAWSSIVHTPVPEAPPADGSFGCEHLVAGLETAIAIGHDTDTVASIAGSLLGARWGYSAIPWQWRRILHGWPGGTAKSLADLAVLAIRGGKPDSHGWPTIERLDYTSWSGHDSYAVHPHDPAVRLSGAAALDDLPSDVTAVVSLARLGTKQVPEHVEHAEFRIIDTDNADNPNLTYAIDDAARAVKTLRDEGHVVLLHCVAAQSRTPSVAARYGVLLGHTVEESIRDVVSALPAANPRPDLIAAVRSLGDPPYQIDLEALGDAVNRLTCPQCGSSETIVRVWGMPTPDLYEFAHSVDWMTIEGCVELLDAWDLGCETCGYRRLVAESYGIDVE